MSCSTFKTLSVSFTAPVIAPANGYKIRWRIAGGTWTDVPNQYNNPVTIANVPACFNLEVAIKADCGGGNFGQEIIAAVTGGTTNCAEFELMATATYTYVPCGQTTPVTVNNNAGSTQSVCAVDGTVSGGPYTYLNSCFV